MATEEQVNPSGSDTDPVETVAEKQPEADQQGGETPRLEDHVQQAEAGSAPGAEALQHEIGILKEELLRVHADMQNLRRRVDRDVENAHKYALEKFVGELVAVVDNLERATATIDRENTALTAVREGIELTLKGFLDVLGKFKVEQVDPSGQPFDPEKHQAMTMVPNPAVAPNTVLDVFQKGYLLNGRLIRPAMVVVAKS